MTGDQRIVCGLCQTPDTDMHLCPTCTGRLTRLLASCRDALRLAPVTIARQGTARAGEHTRAGNPATGAPVNLAAAQARDQLRQVYVRHATTSDTAALYDWAPAWYRDLLAAYKHLMSFIDRPPERHSLGRCTGDGCRGQLLYRTGARTAKCDTCRGTVDVREMRDWQLNNPATDKTAPLPVIVRALQACGVEITQAMADGWARRGKITPCDERGRYSFQQVHTYYRGRL